ncbi:MAG TPA: GNAT family N-acetyltransferase [Actinomycetota bacterium]|nr:GNAT family N-acetyltransferase [Actinomycetota bacterium]
MDDQLGPTDDALAGFDIRHPGVDDYLTIVDAIDAWWDGLLRPANALVQRFFLEHFNDTSFVVHQRATLAAFLIGFLSQSHSNEAYIHFAGVAPQFRSRGLGRHLYELFFAIARDDQRSMVRCITSPSNRDSIAFHKALGFHLMIGEGDEEGIPISRDHGGRGLHMVVFEKDLRTQAT